MTAISVSERLLEMAAFYTPLALTVTHEAVQQALFSPKTSQNTTKKAPKENLRDFFSRLIRFSCF